MYVLYNDSHFVLWILSISEYLPCSRSLSFSLSLSVCTQKEWCQRIEEQREIIEMEESETAEEKEPEVLLRQRPSHSISHSMDSLLSRHSQSFSIHSPLTVTTSNAFPIMNGKARHSISRKSTSRKASRSRGPSFIASRISIVGFGAKPETPSIIYDFPDDVVAMFTAGNPSGTPLGTPMGGTPSGRTPTPSTNTNPYHSYAPTPSNSSLEDNMVLKRVIYVLQMYKEWIQSMTDSVQESALKTMYEMMHELPEYSMTGFLNDFHHLLLHHNSRLQEIQEIARKQIDGICGDWSSSIEVRRHFRDRMGDRDLYFAETVGSNLDMKEV